MRIALFASDEVGCHIAHFLAERGEQLTCLVLDPLDRGGWNKNMIEALKLPPERIVIANAVGRTQLAADLAAYEPDLAILAWWPYLLDARTLRVARRGTLNFHPSLLPSGRGKSPNFWSIVEGTPFGVTIHFVDEGIDSGAIAFQREIPVTWEDTGETLHRKAREALVTLFIENFDRIKAGDIPRHPQPSGTVCHFQRQLDLASRIELDRTYSGRELLNLLRAEAIRLILELGSRPTANDTKSASQSLAQEHPRMNSEQFAAHNREDIRRMGNDESRQAAARDRFLRASQIERIPVAGPWITQKEIDYVTDAVTNCWYGQANKYHDRFEKTFAEYIGAKYAVALPSCTSAIHLSLESLGIGPGDEVIVPDVTWIASAAPIEYVGASPVFADIDRETWCLSPESFAARVTDRTKAVIVVDLYGNMPRMNDLLEIAHRHQIAVIEDAAEAFGSEFGGQKAGRFGHTGVFSFHGSKTMTTGEGGMLVTDRKELYDRILFLRDHGRVPGDVSFRNREVAFKYKMSSLQAALGLAQVERADELVRRKREIFAWYAEFLRDLPGVTLNAEPAGTRNSYWMVTAVLDATLGLKKEALGQRLGACGVDTRPFFHPLSSLPAYEHLAEAATARHCNRVAYEVSPHGINLPCAMLSTRDQVDFVCSEFRSIVMAAAAERCQHAA